MEPSQNHSENRSSIQGKHEIKELQTTAIPGTAQILREVLMQKYKTFITANDSACVTHCTCNTVQPRNMAHVIK